VFDYIEVWTAGGGGAIHYLKNIVDIEEIFHYSAYVGTGIIPPQTIMDLWTLLPMESFLLGYRLNAIPLDVSRFELIYQCDANRIWIHQ
jgi:hypothetical protein